MYTKILKLINEYETIIIYRHARPDGDALGSQLGLKEVIMTNFPQKKVYAVGDTTSRYDFMGAVDEDKDIQYEGSLAFILDCSETSLVSNKGYLKASKVIKIDHHIYREKFGDVEVVEESFESCCGLLVDILYKLKLKVNAIAAKLFYTGIVTDSGRFRYDSTSSRTFSICAKLLEEKFDVQEIYNNLYIEDLENILLRSRYFLKMKLTPANVAYIISTKEELLKENVDVFTISRSIVNTMAGIKGIDIWANFTEDINGSGVFVEIRSSKYNINPVATKYGGGGHAKASGATVASFEIVKQILNDLDKIIEGTYE